jgi:predicted O-methyltransferase YrrM
MEFDLSTVRTEPSFGQLYPAERALLRAMVLAKRPRTVLEVGTWKGGGSTFQIVSALTAARMGHLHTCEPNTELHAIAAQQYRGASNITTHNLYSHDLIDRLFAENDVPDFVFFDGPDDPQVALSDLRRLEERVAVGTVFMMHDWDDIKASAVRPYLERSTMWHTVARYSTAWVERESVPQRGLRVRLSRNRQTVGIVAAVRVA